MEYEQFVTDVEEFFAMAEEYMAGARLTFERNPKDPTESDDFSATIELTMPYGGKKRLISVEVNSSGDAAISLPEDNYLELDSTGLYLWLWQEAEAELALSARKIENAVDRCQELITESDTREDGVIYIQNALGMK